tara:strand:- start:6292 stop:7974 length:1683 start_codon:yes stop_codon:yes gene_type:complete
MNRSNAILITSIDQISKIKDLIPDQKEATVVASNYPIIQLNNKNSLEYLMDYCETNIDLYALVKEIALKWSKGILSNDPDIGLLLRYRLSILLSNNIRAYFSILSLSLKFKHIYVPSTCPQYIQDQLTFFHDKFISYKSNDRFNEAITSSPNRGKIMFPRQKSYISRLLKLIQLPFKFILKNKVLVINDWTFPSLKQKKFLNINKLNIFRSFYIDKSSYNEDVKKLFPDQLEIKQIRKNLENIIKKFTSEKKIINDLVILFSSIISKEYHESKNDLRNMYSSVEKMIEFYSPKKIIVPGWSMSFYQIIYFIFKEKKIPTIMVPDGIYFFMEPYLYPKYNKEIDPIQYYALQGKNVIELFTRNLNIDENRIFNIFPPVIKNLKVKRKKILSNIIVLFPTPIVWSPDSRWDQRYLYVVEVIRVLKKIYNNDYNINVKVKPGAIDQSKDIAILRSILDVNDFKNIDILEGDLDKYLDDAFFCVGQMSSALFEFLYKNVSFYIYEPPMMGKNNKIINNSIIDKSQISLNTTDLEKSIINKNKATFKMDNFFTGKDIDHQNFLDK